jgi:hypothetical protein
MTKEERKEYNRNYRLENKEYHKKWREDNKEHIEKYRLKNRDKFNENQRQKYKENPEPQIQSSQDWNNKNQDRVRANSKKNREENPDRVIERNKKWREENPNYGKEWRMSKPGYHNNYHKTRYASDVEYKLQSVVRSRIQYHLGNKKSRRRSCELLGCTYEEYALYLEERFDQHMTWDNYGKDGYWEIDHIHPVSKGGSFHYTNTQPLPIIENRKKGNKIIC